MTAAGGPVAHPARRPAGMAGDGRTEDTGDEEVTS